MATPRLYACLLLVLLSKIGARGLDEVLAREHPVCKDPREPTMGEGLVFSRGGSAAKDNLRDTLASVATDQNLVIITTSDFKFRTFVVNLVCAAKSLSINNTLVMALDPKLHKFLSNESINTFYSPTLSTQSVRDHGEAEDTGHWNSPTYNNLVHMKTFHIAAVLNDGFNVLFVDADIVLLQDIRPAMHGYLSHISGPEVVMQQNWEQNELNPGFSLWRSSPGAMKFLDLVLATECNLETGGISRGGYGFGIRDDQHAYNYVLACGQPDGGRSTWLWKEHEKSHMLSRAQVEAGVRPRAFRVDCSSANGLQVTYGLFDPLKFQTGSPKYEGLRSHAAIIHPNFMVKWKAERLKRAGLWCLDNPMTFLGNASQLNEFDTKLKFNRRTRRLTSTPQQRRKRSSLRVSHNTSHAH